MLSAVYYIWERLSTGMCTRYYLTILVIPNTTLIIIISRLRYSQYSRTGLPIVVLMCKDLTFCQFFLSKDTRKLMPNAKRLLKKSTMEQGVRRTQHHVSKHLIIVHLDVANSDPQAKNFFELELDGWTDFSDFVVEVFIAWDWSWELAGWW